jgi:diaminopimelate decarboxylase
MSIVGVDYSNRSSGLHWTDFDRIWLQRPWNEMDLDTLYVSDRKYSKRPDVDYRS